MVRIRNCLVCWAEGSCLEMRITTAEVVRISALVIQGLCLLMDAYVSKSFSPTFVRNLPVTQGPHL